MFRGWGTIFRSWVLIFRPWGTMFSPWRRFPGPISPTARAHGPPWARGLRTLCVHHPVDRPTFPCAARRTGVGAGASASRSHAAHGSEPEGDGVAGTWMQQPIPPPPIARAYGPPWARTPGSSRVHHPAGRPVPHVRRRTGLAKERFGKANGGGRRAPVAAFPRGAWERAGRGGQDERVGWGRPPPDSTCSYRSCQRFPWARGPDAPRPRTAGAVPKSSQSNKKQPPEGIGRLPERDGDQSIAILRRGWLSIRRGSMLPDQGVGIDRLNYPTRDRTDCGAALACATAPTLVCCRICCLASWTCWKAKSASSI